MEETKLTISGIFLNCDETILNLNSYLEKFGYIIKARNIEYICENYGQLRGDFDKAGRYIKVKDSIGKECTIPESFYHLYKANASGIISKLDNSLKLEDTYELSLIKKLTLSKNGNTIDINRLTESSDLYNFQLELIDKLRLMSSGKIRFHGPITYKQGHTYQKSGILVSDMSRSSIHLDIYTLPSNYSSTPILKESRENIEKLPEIVWESFDKYYSLDSKEWKLRYLLLFIILEALLGRGEKISHTIARHSAIIIGNELETGESIYDEIKNLYNLRSKIAHGEGIKEIRKAKRKIGGHAVKKLEQKVRKVMIYAIKYSKSEGEFNSKKLYQYLNTCGYTKKQ